VVEDIQRFGALVLGPGLGRSETVADDLAAVLAAAAIPAVIDGDGLYALARARSGEALLDGRSAATILTPHDGEFRTLTGDRPPASRIDAARQVAAQRSCTVLLKGPTTTIAAPDGEVRIVTTGDERLATAGTGDVLSGIAGAMLALGLDPLSAASCAAWIHGAAAQAGPRDGFVASDLLGAIPNVLEALRAAR
jgi:NAD(P)H-hydrate epimerase